QTVTDGPCAGPSTLWMPTRAACTRRRSWSSWRPAGCRATVLGRRRGQPAFAPGSKPGCRTDGGSVAGPSVRMVAADAGHAPHVHAGDREAAAGPVAIRAPVVERPAVRHRSRPDHLACAVRE